MGCVSKYNDNHFPSLSSADAKNGVGWYNITLGYKDSNNYGNNSMILSGNLYFDGTYFNGCLSGMFYYTSYNSPSYSSTVISIIVNNDRKTEIYSSWEATLSDMFHYGIPQTTA